MVDLHTTMKINLKAIQKWQKTNVDAFRKEQPSFKVGNEVLLLYNNIKTNWLYHKLDYRRLC